MKLMTDAPRHNLALMRISAHHKAKGDNVFLGSPLDEAEYSYGSWLFSKGYPCDKAGGPGYDISIRLNGVPVKPDYDLYNIDYSLGSTWEYCPRKCGFCCVPKQLNPKTHYSIWQFHDPEFNKICLLNNNTLTDPQWHETFEEIWDAGLVVIDENGYDLRLLSEESLLYLNKTRFEGMVHFAWDDIQDEQEIRRGLDVLVGIKHPVQIYVLVGFPDHRPIDETDLYRCQVISDYGFDPFVMVYNRKPKSREPRMVQLNQFQRLVNRVFIWRKLGFKEAWRTYRCADK